MCLKFWLQAECDPGLQAFPEIHPGHAGGSRSVVTPPRFAERQPRSSILGLRDSCSQGTILIVSCPRIGVPSNVLPVKMPSVSPALNPVACESK